MKSRLHDSNSMTDLTPQKCLVVHVVNYRWPGHSKCELGIGPDLGLPISSEHKSELSTFQNTHAHQ